MPSSEPQPKTLLPLPLQNSNNTSPLLILRTLPFPNRKPFPANLTLILQSRNQVPLVDLLNHESIFKGRLKEPGNNRAPGKPATTYLSTGERNHCIVRARFSCCECIQKQSAATVRVKTPLFAVEKEYPTHPIHADELKFLCRP